MNRLENDLRMTLRARALDANTARTPTWDPPARRPWSSRPWFVPAVASVSAFAFLAATAFVVTTLSIGPSPVPAPGQAATGGSAPATSSSPSAVATIGKTTPDGRTAFSYRGVEVLVPKEYVRSVARCDGYGAPVVVVGDGDACATPPPDSLEMPVVRMASTDSAWAQQYTPLLTRRITIGGEQVFVEAGCTDCREGNLRGTSVLHFADRRVVVAVSTWDADLAAEILETAQAVTVD